MNIAIKRVYEDAANDDGTRILVDRLWPRGVSKDRAALDEWYKDVAPTDELRKWFGHDPAKWDGFQQRFRAELDANQAGWEPLLDKARQSKKLTLLFSAHDTEHNNAVVLKQYLDERADG